LADSGGHLVEKAGYGRDLVVRIGDGHVGPLDEGVTAVFDQLAARFQQSR
jgi:hypothetical protein